ncbi:VWA domain-containing protein [Acidobacteriota bacterium]
MYKKLSLCFLSFLLAMNVIGIQQEIKIPKTEEHEVAVRLVLVDVIATGKDGKVIPDLKMSDFEVFEDGKKVPIRSLDFVQYQAPGMDATDAEQKLAEALRKRSFFVIFDSINSVKRMLDINKDKILENLQSLVQLGHEVMIFELKEDSNMQVLQPLTKDKQLIAAAVKKASGSIWVDKMSDALSTPRIISTKNISRRADMAGHISVEQMYQQSNRNILETQMRWRFEKTINGLLSVLNIVKEYPGRKPLLYISSGLPTISFLKIFDQGDRGDINIAQSEVAAAKINDPFKVLQSSKRRGGQEIIEDLINFSNSHNISFYTMDPDDYLRYSLPDIAYDNFPRKITSQYDFTAFEDEITKIKKIELSGLKYLAEDTGGIPLQGGSRFENFQKLVSRDMSSYYELSYTPHQSRADGKYHKIKVTLKRKGASLRHREGYQDYNSSQRESLQFASASANPEMFKDFSYQVNTVPFIFGSGKIKLWINMGLPVQELVLGGDPNRDYKIIKSSIWVEDEEEKKAFNARMDFPILLTPSFRERLKNARYFGRSLCSDEIKIPKGKYRLVFAIFDEETQSMGTEEEELVIPDLKGKSPTFVSSLFGRLVASPEAKNTFDLTEQDGTLSIEGKKLHPLGANQFGRSENMALFSQIFNPEGQPLSKLEFSLIQDGYIVGDIPAQELIRSPNQKAKVINFVHVLQFSRYEAGQYQIKIQCKDSQGNSIIKYIDLHLL